LRDIHCHSFYSVFDFFEVIRDLQLILKLDYRTKDLLYSYVTEVVFIFLFRIDIILSEEPCEVSVEFDNREFIALFCSLLSHIFFANHEDSIYSFIEVIFELILVIENLRPRQYVVLWLALHLWSYFKNKLNFIID
jgi:hypothetical protein